MDSLSNSDTPNTVELSHCSSHYFAQFNCKFQQLWVVLLLYIYIYIYILPLTIQADKKLELASVTQSRTLQRLLTCDNALTPLMVQPHIAISREVP